MNTTINSCNEFSVEPILEMDIYPICKMCVELFSEATGNVYTEEFFAFMSDFSISRKAVLNGKIIGCYLLNDDSILSYNFSSIEDLSNYHYQEGLQGVALGILKEYRGLSFGRKLRDSALMLPHIDYIWGFNVKILNNLENWKRYGRRQVGENESSYVTLMDISMKARMSA